MALQRAQYKPDRQGIARYLRSAALRGAVRSRAEQGAAMARLRLPSRSGTLRASVHVEDADIVVGGRPRVAALIVADAPYAPAVEFGTRGGRRGQHVMGGVADSLSSRRRRV